MYWSSVISSRNPGFSTRSASVAARSPRLHAATSDRPGDILGKVGDWLSAGTRLVWVIDPVHRVAHVYRQDETQKTIGPQGALDGEDVLPGFSCALDAIL